jgi:putative ABC transport system substrate-binding protein
MVQLGYVEGRNLVLESRYGRGEALPALAADLVRLQVDVIVTITTPAAQAAKAATASIPIVMAGSANPVGLGLVASLSHPGANVTGVTNNPGQGFVLKQLQLLKEAAPKISRVAVIKTDHPFEDAAFGAMELAAPQLGVVPVAVVLDASTRSDVRLLLTQARPDALYVFPNSTNDFYAGAIAAFAAENRLPTIYGGRDGVHAGGLLSYGVNWLDLRRHAAVYVDKILKGAKPADLPVEGPVKFEMVVNLKTAKALGLTIAPSVLLQATEVIE